MIEAEKCVREVSNVSYKQLDYSAATLCFYGICVGYKFRISEHHEFEDAATLRASDVLSPDLLKGAHHRVENEVKKDGYLNYYKIKSDYARTCWAAHVNLELADS